MWFAQSAALNIGWYEVPAGNPSASKPLQKIASAGHAPGGAPPAPADPPVATVPAVPALAPPMPAEAESPPLPTPALPPWTAEPPAPSVPPPPLPAVLPPSPPLPRGLGLAPSAAEHAQRHNRSIRSAAARRKQVWPAGRGCMSLTISRSRVPARSG